MGAPEPARARPGAAATSRRPSSCRPRSARRSGRPTRRCPESERKALASRAKRRRRRPAQPARQRRCPSSRASATSSPNPSLSAAPVEAGRAHRGAGRARARRRRWSPASPRRPRTSRPACPRSPPPRASSTATTLLPQRGPQGAGVRSRRLGAGRPPMTGACGRRRGGRASAEPASPPGLLALRGRAAVRRGDGGRLAVRPADPAAPRAAGQRRAAGLPVRRARRLLRLVLVARRPDAGDEDLAHPASQARRRPAAEPRARAARYVASWLWFAAGAAPSAHVAGLRSVGVHGLHGGGRRGWPTRCWRACTPSASSGTTCCAAPGWSTRRQAPIAAGTIAGDDATRTRGAPASTASSTPTGYSIAGLRGRLASAKARFARSAGWPWCCCRPPSGSAAAGSRWRCWPAR